jgi:hypothetical protein
VFSAVPRRMVTSSVTLDSPSMTLSETQIDKFCQSLFISRHLQTASQMPQLPYWERWPFLFLRQPPLAVSMPWEYQSTPSPAAGKFWA